MSASPDFMQSLMAMLNQPATQTALGILGASGPSRMTTSVGQVLGQGYGQGMEFQNQALQQAMQKLMLGQNMYGMQALQDAYGNNGQQTQLPAWLGGGNSQQPPQVPSQASPQVPSQPPSPVSAPSITPPSANAPQAPQATPQAAPQAPATQLPPQPAWYSQVAKDTRTLDALSKSPMWKDQAAALRDRMQNTWYPATPQMVQQYTGAPPEKGYAYQVNELGQFKPSGESIYSMGTAPGPGGIPQTFIFNKATGATSWPASGASSRVPGTPLGSSADESYAQGLAEYRYKPPGVSGRNSEQAMNWLARAHELNPAYDENAYDAKHAAYVSLANGKDYQQNSAYSTIQTHMKTLDDAMSAVNNGDVQTANKLTQWSGTQFGKSAPQNAKVVNDIVVGELSKVLAQGGQVTDSIRREASGMLEPYLSKGQYQGATEYIRQLIAGKMNTSYINAMANKIPEDVFLSHLSPEAREQLQLFQQQHPDQSQAVGGHVLNYDPATGTFK